MLTLNYFSELKDKTIQGLIKRNWDSDRLNWVDMISTLDLERKDIQTELDTLKMVLNQDSKEIGNLMKAGKSAQAEVLRDQVTINKSKIADFEDKKRINKDSLQELLYKIPNIPHVSVPAGKSPEDNEVYKEWSGPLPNLFP